MRRVKLFFWALFGGNYAADGIVLLTARVRHPLALHVEMLIDGMALLALAAYELGREAR